MKRVADLEQKAPVMMLESLKKMRAKKLMTMMMKMMIELVNNISHKEGLILKADMKFKDKCKIE